MPLLYPLLRYSHPRVPLLLLLLQPLGPAELAHTKMRRITLTLTWTLLPQLQQRLLPLTATTKHRLKWQPLMWLRQQQEHRQRLSGWQ